jgi:hypothetical protein
VVDTGAQAAWVRSVDVGKLVANPAKVGATTIAKRPVAGPVSVPPPGTRGESGVGGDVAAGDELPTEMRGTIKVKLS